MSEKGRNGDDMMRDLTGSMVEIGEIKRDGEGNGGEEKI